MSDTADKKSTVIPITAATPTVNEAGEMVWMYEGQKKIYPRSVKGWFVNWRWALVWFTQLIYYGLPWIEWGERQAVLFDLAARRFYIFGLVLYPQDFIYLTALLVVSAYALFLFTAVAGRLWCGYACPQTVYTEMYLWVEKHIEGDRNKRMKLDEGPWTAEKVLRKSAKHAVWIAIGLWTGFTLVGYFTPIKVLWAEAFTLGFGPWEWFWVVFYGFATYGNAGFMREQVCKYMCPYARFQSAMFDKDTLIVTYDDGRGEPRGSRPKKLAHSELQSQGKGECIDCNLCVQVCPTGIDIRKGLQYECIGCAACIDVCNEVMDKMSYPRGLIRYSTQNAIHQGWNTGQMWRRVFRPRVLIYTAILLIIIGLFFASLSMRDPFRVNVVRDRASLARIVDDGFIENTYRLQVMNASEASQRYTLAVKGVDGIALTPMPEIVLGPTETKLVTVNVRIPPESARKTGPGAHPMVFEITDAQPQGATLVEKSTFIVPR